MNKKMKFAAVGLCALGMSSCAMMDDPNLNYPAYSTYDNSQMYSSNNFNTMYSNYQSQPKQEVVVPDSYHVGEARSPVSFQDRDQIWVNSQNPQSYTIELAEGEKAAQVAQTLYKAPKNDRMAQVKALRDGKTYYHGVYGSYSSAAEAQKALDALPAEVKSGASVKNWSSVQQ